LPVTDRREYEPSLGIGLISKALALIQRHGKTDSVRGGFGGLAFDGLLEGFQVVAVEDASKAMRACDNANFDLVILDLRLKSESGIMLMRFLKKNHPTVPILLYTGLDHDDVTIDILRNEGADDYLHKGTMEELLKKVSSIIR
jgi:CheY-like chemotaxis protein